MKIKLIHNPGFNDFFMPLLFVILNILLKTLFLDYRDLSVDEPYTVFYSQKSLSELLKMFETENNPPLFFLILHFWIRLFGISVFAVRFLPMIFSSLTVLFLYKTGKRFFNNEIAITTSILYTFSNFHQFYSQETRVYSLYCLLSVISMYLFLFIISGKGKRNHYVWLLVTNTLLIYSHFFGFFIIVVQIASAVFIAPIRRHYLKGQFIILAFTIILYIPYLRLIIQRFLVASEGTWLSPPGFADIYNLLWSYTNVPVVTVLTIVLLAISAFLFICRRIKQSNIRIRNYVKVIYIWFFLPLIVIFAVSQIIPAFHTRYMIFLSIAYYFLLAFAVETFPRKWLRYILILGITGAMAGTFHAKVTSDRSMKTVTEMVKKQKAAVYVVPYWMIYEFTYYYNSDYFRKPDSVLILLQQEQIRDIKIPEDFSTEAISGLSEVILIEGGLDLVDPEGSIIQRLQASFPEKSLIYESKSLKVYHFKEE